MGKVNDYINSLEGKENLDPAVIASTLLELHNEEISVYNAKIDTLNETIVTKDTEIAKVANDLKDAKSANWDLINSSGVVDENNANGPKVEIGEETYENVLFGEN